MSGFDADWLALREPADARARSTSLADALADWLALRCDRRAARILDLGCGSGANPRWLAPRLGLAQRWVCVDDDARLLAGLAADAALDFVAAQRHDLARGFAPLEAEPRDLVTASALLDLVSADWLDALLAFASSARAAVLFALNCDGRVAIGPAHPADAGVFAAFAAHQRRDKGFGPALGSEAPSRVERALRSLGYEVRGAASDWRIGAEEPALAREWLAGVASAAREQEPSADASIAEWLARRTAQADAGALRITVGHRDLLGLPPQ